MNILVPLWALILFSDRSLTRTFYIALGVMFHWFTVLLILIYLVCRLKSKTLLLLLCCLPILFNHTIIHQLISFCEIIIGNSTYTDLLGKYLGNLPQIPLFISVIFIILYLVKAPNKVIHILDGRYGLFIKTTTTIILFAFTLYEIGLSSSYALRVTNLTIIPVLYLIMYLFKGKKFFLSSFFIYFFLSLNLTLKTLS